MQTADQRASRASYGCFQVHDYMNKQTVLAVNNLLASKGQHDVGIGNQKRKHSEQPDWTFARNAAKYRDAKQMVQFQVFFQTKAPKKD